MTIPILDQLQLPAWTAYTPVLTADTTNPTLGTGSVQLGRYIRLGSLMIVHFRIVFGTSGVAAGSGAYHISIPVAAEGSIVRRQLGTVHLLDQSATITKVAIARLDDTPFTTFQMNQVDTTGFGGVGNNTPWTWAASDVLSGYLVCEVAP